MAGSRPDILADSDVDVRSGGMGGVEGELGVLPDASLGDMSHVAFLRSAGKKSELRFR